MTLNSHILSGRVAVVELNGRLETAMSQELVKWLNAALNDDHSRIVVNLRGVTLIGSTGLSALIYGLKRCRERNGDLYLCTVPDPVQSVFTLTRLNQVFKIFRDEAEALRAFMD